MYLNKIENTKDKLIIKENNIEYLNITNNSFSKNTNHLLDLTIINNMKFGEKMHYYLELTDLKTKDISFIKDEVIKEKNK